MSAAGAGGDALYIENVFRTSLYKGTSAQHTITNGIDFSNEGGLVWTKSRDNSTQHGLCDTVATGVGKDLSTSSTAVLNNEPTAIDQFNSDGYRIAGNATNYNNSSIGDYCSWNFRKAQNFFDIQTWSGNGATSRTISHNLGSTPGMIVVKCTNITQNWVVWHKSLAAGKFLLFNESNAVVTNSAVFTTSSPTASQFYVGSDYGTNGSGGNYVAYIFADSGAGGFGINADQDVIKCGSYTGNNSTDGPTINLGFEPQWVIVKNTTNQYIDWYIFDSMRALTAKGLDANKYLRPNSTGAEDGSQDYITPRPDGFQVHGTGSHTNANTTYVYMAIRRGPMAIPESSSSCFAIETRGETSPNPPAFNASFDVDFSFRGVPSASFLAARQIQGGYISTSSNSARVNSSTYSFDFSNGWWNNSSTSTSDFGYMWGRAPEFCDVVTYVGNGSNRTIEHNLTTQPDMFWIKRWDTSGVWAVWHTGLTGNNKYIRLDQAMAEISFDLFNNTAPTSSNFSVGTNGNVNASNNKYICLLFGSLSGISKCGSYTGNGSSQNIDCGFSNGSKLVIIKSLSASGSWHLYDTDRSNGLVAGNDTSYDLDTASGFTADAIDPVSSGFTVNSTGNLTNSSGVTYIFYAIAA